MHSNLVTIILTVFVAGSASKSFVLDDEHTWTGSVSTSYLEGGNWTPTGPPTTGDVIYVDDPSVRDTCIVDAADDVSLLRMELQGNTPTKMTFFVRDKPVTLTYRPCGIYDYGVLKADKNFTSDLLMELGGELWIDIAPNATSTVTVYFKSWAGVGVDGITTVHLDDHSLGVLKMDNLYVDATLGLGNRSLTLDGPNSTATVLNLLYLAGDSTTDDKKAKLWHKAGTLLVASGGATHAVLDVNGGPSGNSKVDIDIDAAFEADECQFSGWSTLDVASGLTAYGGDVIFYGGSDLRARKTGSGTFRSGSAP